MDASFAGDLQDSKSTSDAILVIVGPNTRVPFAWICKKQGAVSHSSSEAEIISLEASLRIEGLPALLLWDLVIGVRSAGGNSTLAPTTAAATTTARGRGSGGHLERCGCLRAFR